MRGVIIAWGQRHLDYLERACVRSLMQPQNRAALEGITIELHAFPGDGSRAVDVLSRLGLKLEVHPIAPSTDPVGFVPQRLLIQALKNARGDQLLILPPDTFWGEGSIPALIECGRPRGTVVAIPHARVNDAEFLQILPDGVVENSHLVELAIRTLHKSFAEAIEGKKPANSWRSGVRLKMLTEKVWLVQHRIPTPYLVNVLPNDAEWMAAETRAGAWDHRWPEQLFKAGRWRVIAGSDAAFCVELTPEHENHPPIEQYDHAEPDAFKGTLMHHHVDRVPLCVWRAAC